MGIHLISPLYKMVIAPPAPEVTTAYFYPNAHPELTSVDGWVRQSSTAPASSWADVRDGPGTSNSSDGAYHQMGIYSGSDADEWTSLYRGILLYDTSSIGPGKTILAVKLRLTCVSVNLVPEWPASALVAVSSLPFVNNDLQNSDYATLGIIPFSNTIPFSSFSAGADQTLVFNPDGLLAIDPEGITKLGLREDAYDRADIAPPWPGRRYLWLRTGTAEQADILHRPRLKVVYQ